MEPCLAIIGGDNIIAREVDRVGAGYFEEDPFAFPDDDVKRLLVLL